MTTTSDVGSPPTFQPNIAEQADTWFADLQGDNGQQGYDIDLQYICRLIYRVFPAFPCLSSMGTLLDFAVNKPLWIQTLRNEFLQSIRIFQTLAFRIGERGYKPDTRAQCRKVARYLSKVSKKQRARLEKTNTAVKKVG